MSNPVGGEKNGRKTRHTVKKTLHIVIHNRRRFRKTTEKEEEKKQSPFFSVCRCFSFHISGYSWELVCERVCCPAFLFRISCELYICIV